MKVPIRLRIGPLPVAIHVVQNCHAGEQQKAYIILTGNFLCLAANCVLPHFSRLRDSKNERIRRARVKIAAREECDSRREEGIFL